MQRILFWLGVILLANWWWRKQSRAALERMRARQADGRTGPSGSASAGAPRVLAAEPMARCATCGLHLPQSDAIVAGGRHFCGIEHARAAGEQA